MPQRRKLIYGAIFTLAAIVHVAAASDKALWYDEVATASYAAKSLTDLWKFLWNYDVHPPLFYVVEKVFSILPIGEEWSLRLFPLLCSVLTIPLVEALAFRVTRVRYWGALLAGIFPGLVIYGVEARAYAPLVFFQFAALYCAVRMRDDEGNDLRWLIGATAFLLLGMWMHYFAVFFAVPLGVLLVLWSKNKKQAALVLAGAIVLYLPWLPRAFETFFGEGDALQDAQPRFLVVADYWRVWSAHWGNLVTAVLGLAAMAYGAVRHWRHPLTKVLAVLFAFPIAVFFFIPPEYPIFAPRYLLTWAALPLPLVPAVFAAGKLRWAGLVILTLVVSGELVADVQHARDERVWNREIATHYDEYFADGDVLIVDPYYQSFALLHYLPLEHEVRERLMENPLNVYDALRLDLDGQLLAITSHEALVPIISDRKELSGNMWLLSYGELRPELQEWEINMTPIGRWDEATLYRVTSPVRYDPKSDYLFLGSIPLGKFAPPQAPSPVTGE